MSENCNINYQKAAIIGCGFVGASIAFTLMQRSTFSEMVLIDIDPKKAEGEALDISHGLPYSAPMEIYAGSYDDLTDAALIVIAAGANQKEGETRLDLIDKNLKIFSAIIPELKKRNCEGIVLVVSNPVDILTYAAVKMSGFPSARVIGSGTVLDTARLKYLLGRQLDVDARSVHAVIIGEHGDSELAVWSGANISGVDLSHFCELRGLYNYKAEMQKIYSEVRDSAYEIIRRKGATYYGIAMAVARIAESIMRDEHSILPVSTLLNGEYGIEGLCLSIPSVVGSMGVEKILDIPLSGTEQRELTASAAALREAKAHADKAAEEL
ncbi:MAG: L-lactate dehydrogenase [Firmicutes bacterium]|nr:L-lactate dehydrogenase [[Eubacterium] siraeum]MCM1487160.1 L-lactate dehydrogenase [Bacillota bacterium]